MRIIVLLAFLCSFALCSEVRWPEPDKVPGWANSLNAAWDDALGKSSPKPGSVAWTDASIAYTKVFDVVFAKWVRQINATGVPDDNDYSGNTRTLNQMLANIRQDRELKRETSPKNFLHNDIFFETYAIKFNDPKALLFLWSPEKRAKYGAPN